MRQLLDRVGSALDPPIAPLSEMVRAAAHPLTGMASDYDGLLALIGEARFVLLGEASHGTHDFYRQRAQITKRLIVEKGFTAVAVEADWPDAYRVNRFVRGTGDGATAIASLASFQRFPTWMWRNADVLDFVGALRAHNAMLPADTPKVGFYGLDLYSLHASLTAAIDYLETVDPAAAQRARERYTCYYFGENPRLYGYATRRRRIESCEDEVVNQLVELQRHTTELRQRDGWLDTTRSSRLNRMRG